MLTCYLYLSSGRLRAGPVWLELLLVACLHVRLSPQYWISQWHVPVEFSILVSLLCHMDNISLVVALLLRNSGSHVRSFDFITLLNTF